MGWLGECAKVVAAHGHCMEWVTPMGLPVIQPYRRKVRLGCPLSLRRIGPCIAQADMHCISQPPILWGSVRTGSTPMS